MPKITTRRLRPEDATASSASASKSPRVVVRVASFITALVERDEIVAKLGGESTKTLAMDKMHAMVAQFFSTAANLDRCEVLMGANINSGQREVLEQILNLEMFRVKFKYFCFSFIRYCQFFCSLPLLHNVQR